ncbi:MAG: hypothetical protein QOF72_2527 [Blastocatellia bacterium]|nr:hypothetical protein [Blastocatellia bacterium]
MIEKSFHMPISDFCFPAKKLFLSEFNVDLTCGNPGDPQHKCPVVSFDPDLIDLGSFCSDTSKEGASITS